MTSCRVSNKQIIRQQHLEEGVESPTSVEELKDAIEILEGEISKAYYKLIYQMWKGTDMAIAPSEFRTIFCKKEDYFNNYEQHDSQEFLLALLNNIHDDLNRVTNKQYMELKEKQKKESDLQASDRYWNYHKSRENSIIVDLFQGQYKSTIKCTSCKTESVTFDTYMNLQLPIPEYRINP